MGAWGGECCTEQMGGMDFYEKDLYENLYISVKQDDLLLSKT